MKTIRRILTIIFETHFICAALLPPFLSLIVLVLAWGEWDVSQNGAKIPSFFQTVVLVLFIYCMLGMYVGSLQNRFYQELIYLPIYLFSVYVAYRGGSIYGAGLAIVLTFLLVPYYIVWLYRLRIMIKELPARKLLLGREGPVCNIGQFQIRIAVNIDGAEYWVSPGKASKSHCFRYDDVVVVTKVLLNDMIVELKDNTEQKNEVNEV